MFQGTLEEFKKEYKLLDENIENVVLSYEKVFETLIYDLEEDSINKYKIIEELFNACKKINSNYIPYEGITNIIFSNYTDSEILQEYSRKLKRELELFINKEFNNGKSGKEAKIRVDDENTDAMLVIYKIIQHTDLAISQKTNLYNELSNDIDYLRENLDESISKYDNMLSNFISILGIFSAIMMGTFGAIQGFSAIYINENNYNISTLLLISSFGLLSLIVIISILFYGISRLTDKEMSDTPWTDNVFKKYPIYSHSVFLVLSLFYLTSIHQMKTSPPKYFSEHFVDNLWKYSMLMLILLILLYLLNSVIKSVNGYSSSKRQITNFIEFKRTKTTRKKFYGFVYFIVAVVTMIVIGALVLLIVN